MSGHSKLKESLHGLGILPKFFKFVLCTVEPRYNEVPRYRKKYSLWRGLRYSEDPVITNYLVNSKNIRYSGVSKLDQAEQWDIQHAKQSSDLRVNSYI